MITVDISNIWGQVTLPDLLAMEQEVNAAQDALTNRSGAGKEMLGWLDLPTRERTEELRSIQTAAERIRGDSDICVVIGTGGHCMGAQAVIEAMQGPDRNLGRAKGDPQILFAGNSLSTRRERELQRLLEGKDVSIIVISKSGTTLEPAIAFRSLRWMMERKYGTDEANRRIYAVTDPVTGGLRRMANDGGWEAFAIPANVGGRYAVLTAAGLLPMAVAGLDIEALLSGAMDAREQYDLWSFENPVWLYAAVRNLMLRTGKDVELFTTFEPGLAALGSWWRQLFAQSEGKEDKGLFPATAEFPRGLHSLGQRIQQGSRNLFETMIRFAPPEESKTIGADWKNLDELDYLEGKTLGRVEELAFLGTVCAHVDGGVPVITMDCGPLSEASLGELIYFLELSCAVSAYILGVNPFDQPGVEAYKQSLFRLLGKPGYEDENKNLL